MSWLWRMFDVPEVCPRCGDRCYCGDIAHDREMARIEAEHYAEMERLHWIDEQNGYELECCGFDRIAMGM